MNGVRIHQTGAPDVITASDGRLTLSVPIQIKHRSGRKLVTLPNGEAAQPETLGCGRHADATGTGTRLSLAGDARIRRSEIHHRTRGSGEDRQQTVTCAACST